MELFVYGTLTEPARVASLVEAYVFVGPARIEGLRPVQGRYPTLAPGGTVAGRVLRTDEVDAVDAYEGVDDGLYVRVPVPFERDRTDDQPSERADPPADGDPDAGADGGGSNAPDDPGSGSGSGSDPGSAVDVVHVYVGDPDRLGVDVDWPGAGDLRERVARYVAREGVVARPIHS
jgi:gamma-glutamylcyclotransferase (GGCT)/AIG2-like uncharacterized protein YtfP